MGDRVSESIDLEVVVRDRLLEGFRLRERAVSRAGVCPSLFAVLDDSHGNLRDASLRLPCEVKGIL